MNSIEQNQIFKDKIRKSVENDITNALILQRVNCEIFG